MASESPIGTSGRQLIPATKKSSASGAAPTIVGERPAFLKTAAMIAILIGGWLLFGWHVGERGLWSAHEGRAAQNAQNMIDTGDWLTPTLYTEGPDHQKPPLYYWLVAVGAEIIDGEVTTLSVRLPATIAGLIGLLLIFSTGRRMWNWETGLMAAIILGATTRYAWLARVGRIDMPLAVVCLAAFSFFYRWLEDQAHETETKTRSMPMIPLGFYVVTAIGALLKGPIAIVLVLLPVISYLLLTRHSIVPFYRPGWRAAWRSCRFVEGMLIILAIAGPWFAYAIWSSGGEFFWDFFVYHNLDRALGTSEALKSGPIWFYIPRVLVDCFPWSILFPAVGATLWQHRERLYQTQDRWSRTYLFLLCWIGTHFCLLSLVSFKRSDYILPMLPGVALLLAGWLSDRVERFEQRIAARPAKNPRRRARVIRVTALLIAGASAPLLMWAARAFQKRGVVNSIFKIEIFDRYFNITDRFMMEHVERLLRQNWPLLGIGVVVIVACVWLFHTGWHNRSNWRIVSGLAIPWAVCFLFQVQLFLPAIDPLRDMSRFGEVIRTLASNRTIYYFGKFDADLVFYAGKPAQAIGDWEQLVELGKSKEPCFVVMKVSQLNWIHRDPRMASWAPIADNEQTAFGDHRDARVLLTNQPYKVVRRIPPTDVPLTK